MKSSRAVSELVSFTLVFSTIIFLIGAITVTGITTLNDVQAGTETNVAESTMRGYAETLADHRTEGAPRRSTTIKLQGHNLRRVASTLDVNVSRNGNIVSNMSITTGALVRTTNTDTQLVYDSGAVFRIEERGTPLIVRRPPVRCGADSANLPLMSVRGDVNLSSDGRVTMRSELADQTLRYPNNTSQNTSADVVTVNTSQTAYPEAWNRAFEDSGSWTRPTSTADPNVYECRVDRLVVHQTVVDITPVP